MRQLTTIRDVRRLYDIRDVLGMNSKKKLIVCPLPMHTHHSNTASFSIFMTPDKFQKFKCHGNCGCEGDVIDLIGYLRVSGYNPRNGDHVKQALSLLSGGIKINPPTGDTTKQPELNNGLHRRYLPVGDEVRSYAAMRGLRQETLDRFLVGQRITPSAVWMTMPAVHGDRLMGIKMRNIKAENKKMRFAQMPGSVDGLFNFNAVKSAREPVLIVKGEIPVMLLSQFGILACSPTGGEGSYYEHDKFAQALAFSTRRIVIGDNDKDHGVREKMTQSMMTRAEIFRAETRLPPEEYVGVDDWVLARPEEAIPTIREWMK